MRCSYRSQQVVMKAMVPIRVAVGRWWWRREETRFVPDDPSEEIRIGEQCDYEYPWEEGDWNSSTPINPGMKGMWVQAHYKIAGHRPPYGGYGGTPDSSDALLLLELEAKYPRTTETRSEGRAE